MAVPDYYAVLGLDERATDEDIKAAFRRLARQYHPDLNTGTSRLGSRFQAVSDAYAVLGDPVKRAAYDASNATTGAPQPPQSPANTSQPPRTSPAARSAPLRPRVVQVRPAALSERLMASFIDLMIWALIATAWAILGMTIYGSLQLTTNTSTLSGAILTATVLVILLVCPLVYWVVCWATVGRTVGSRCMGTRVVRADGTPLGVERALVRLLACVFSIVVFGFGFWWAAWNPQKLAWHDRVAKSVVQHTAGS